MALKTFYNNFQGYFCDSKGVLYIVSIQTDKKLFPTAKTIRLGATPIVMDCDSDENYFKPVRTKTGKLTVIDEDGTLYDQIMPKDNFSTKVTLSRNSFGIRTWFVSCETFEKPIVSRPHEVTFNLNSFLEMTKFVKADPVYSNTTTLYGLLRSIGKGFNDVGISSFIPSFHIPATYYYKNLIDYSWFFETKKYKDVEGYHVEIVGKSVFSVIEAFCKFYGLVAIENNNGCMFVSDLKNIDYWEYFVYDGQLPNIHNNGVWITYNPIQWSDLVWMGTEQTVNTISPAKSVSVVSKIEEYDNKVSLPSFASNAYHFGEIESRDAQYQCHSLMSDMKNIGGTLTFGNPRKFAVNLRKNTMGDYSVYTITSVGESAGAYPVSDSFLALGYANYPLSKDWDKIGPNGIAHMGELKDAKVWCGAFMVRSEVYESPKKASYSLSDMLFVSGICYNEINGIAPTFDDLFSKMKAATLRSEKYVKIYNGFINIKASAKIIDYYGNFSDADGVILNFQLKIGNRYYSTLNGWTEDESFFSISFKDGKILSNKTSLMQTSEETGFFIEIPNGQYQEGIVEFSVSPAFWKSGGMGDDGKLPMCAMFSELSVNFTYKASDLAFGDRENRFFAMLDAGAKDEIEVENDIASDCYNKAAENVIKNPNTLNNAQTEGYIKPELLLLSRMKEYYSKPRSILSLEVEADFEKIKSRTFYSVIWKDGKTYFPLGYSIDYKANKVNLKLFEQPYYPEDIIP